jgi:hypothetical protein
MCNEELSQYSSGETNGNRPVYWVSHYAVQSNLMCNMIHIFPTWASLFQAIKINQVNSFRTSNFPPDYLVTGFEYDPNTYVHMNI